MYVFKGARTSNINGQVPDQSHYAIQKQIANGILSQAAPINIIINITRELHGCDDSNLTLIYTLL